MTREKIIEFLDHPTTKGGVMYISTSIVLVYLSLVLLAYEQKYWPLDYPQSVIVGALDLLILIFFTLDLLARLVFYRSRWRYVFSREGVIDVLSVVPGLLSYLLPITPTPWLRVLRLLRFFRVLKYFRGSAGVGMVFGGLFTSLLPWLGVAAAVKVGELILLEDRSFWFEPGVLDVPISVIGFAAAILLGAKLAIAQARYYSVEDAICRIVGVLKGMRAREELKETVDRWGAELYLLLKGQETEKSELSLLYDKIVVEAAKVNFDEDVVCDLGKDSEYVMHLVRSRTPAYLDGFMKAAAIVFVALSIAAVPGFTGLITTLAMVMIVGGMYVLIDDLDVPVGYTGQSLINVDLTPLAQYTMRSEVQRVVTEVSLNTNEKAP